MTQTPRAPVPENTPPPDYNGTFFSPASGGAPDRPIYISAAQPGNQPPVIPRDTPQTPEMPQMPQTPQTPRFSRMENGYPYAPEDGDFRPAPAPPAYPTPPEAAPAPETSPSPAPGMPRIHSRAVRRDDATRPPLFPMADEDPDAPPPGGADGAPPVQPSPSDTPASAAGNHAGGRTWVSALRAIADTLPDDEAEAADALLGTLLTLLTDTVGDKPCDDLLLASLAALLGVRGSAGCDTSGESRQS